MLHKTILVLTLAVAALSFASFIEKFDSEVLIYKSGEIRIKESIKVDFELEQRHGIFRTIPIEYRTQYNNSYKLRFELDRVCDEYGKDYHVEVSRKGKDVLLKIGDAQSTVSGVHTYVISYRLNRAVKYFSNHDELWLEVTGHDWEMPIHECYASVMVPSEIPEESIVATCFTGSYGSTSSDCQWTKAMNIIEFDGPFLNSGDGFSVAVKFPHGFVREASNWQKIRWFLSDNWFWLVFAPLPLFVFALLFYKWRRDGIDPLRDSAIMVRYEPPEDLNPAELGTILDERADPSDIAATFVDLAVRGYLKIVEVHSEKLVFFKNNDYALVKLEKLSDDAGLNDFERKFIEYVFEVGDSGGMTASGLGVPEGTAVVLISSLAQKFYAKLEALKSMLYSSLVMRKYFPANPESVRATYVGYGIVAVILGIASAFIFRNAAPVFGFVASGLLFVVFARAMPRKTRRGSAAMLHALGFQMFIEKVEKDRIRVLATEDPKIFDRVLPYAMILGCADSWAEKFSDFLKQSPNWYVGAGAFNGMMFTHSLGNAISSFNQAAVSHPRGSSAAGGGSAFSGGGFSGGGFGGGGGGTW